MNTNAENWGSGALYTAGSRGVHVGMPRWLRGLLDHRKNVDLEDTADARICTAARCMIPQAYQGSIPLPWVICKNEGQRFPTCLMRSISR